MYMPLLACTSLQTAVPCPGQHRGAAGYTELLGGRQMYLKDLQRIVFCKRFVPLGLSDVPIDRVQHLFHGPHQEHFHAAVPVGQVSLLLDVLRAALLALHQGGHQTHTCQPKPKFSNVELLKLCCGFLTVSSSAPTRGTWVLHTYRQAHVMAVQWMMWGLQVPVPAAETPETHHNRASF